MKRIITPLASLAIVLIGLPSLVSAHGKNDRNPVGVGIVSPSSLVRHDNGLHLGQLKQADRKEQKDKKEHKNKEKYHQTQSRLFVSLRGTVSATNSSQLTLTDSGTTTVIDASQALIFGNFWTKITLSDIRVNDQLVVWGTREGSLVKARFIQDLTVQAGVRNPVTIIGSVAAIQNRVLSVQSGSVLYTVNTSNARIVQASGTASTLNQFLVGDQVKVVGTNATGSSNIKATVVTNLSLTSQTLHRIGTSDDNRSITANRGDRFLLDLSNTYHWTATSSDASVVKLARAATTSDEGLYVAQASGNATLTLVGEPTCRSSTPACTMPSIVVRVFINVR